METYSYISLKDIEYPGLIRITTIGDGSCFFHSVLRAFSKTYLELNTIQDRIAYSKILRNLLADSLMEIDSNGKMLYDNLSKGNLREFSKYSPEYELGNLVSELKSLGFTFVTIDLQGFRSGSLNEPLTENQKSRVT